MHNLDFHHHKGMYSQKQKEDSVSFQGIKLYKELVIAFANTDLEVLKDILNDVRHRFESPGGKYAKESHVSKEIINICQRFSNTIGQKLDREHVGRAFGSFIDEAIHNKQLNKHSRSNPESLMKEIETMKSQLYYKDEILASSKQTVENLKDENKMLKQKDSEHLDRISKMMSAQEVGRRDAHEDLMDSNRPSIIAEKFRSLYLNEYGHLSAEIQDASQMEEKEIVPMLLNILLAAMDICNATVESEKRKVCDKLKATFSEAPFAPGTKNTLSKHMYDNICCMLREAPNNQLLEQLSNDVTNKFFYGGGSDIKRYYKQIKVHLKNYINKCVEVTWLMNACNPPLVISIDHKIFNSKTHARFTGKGKFIDYFLWPCLYFSGDYKESNGSVMSKGDVALTNLSPDEREPVGHPDPKEPSSHLGQKEIRGHSEHEQKELRYHLEQTVPRGKTERKETRVSQDYTITCSKSKDQYRDAKPGSVHRTTNEVPPIYPDSTKPPKNHETLNKNSKLPGILAKNEAQEQDMDWESNDELKKEDIYAKMIKKQDVLKQKETTKTEKSINNVYTTKPLVSSCLMRGVENPNFNSDDSGTELNIMVPGSKAKKSGQQNSTDEGDDHDGKQNKTTKNKRNWEDQI